MLIKQKNNEKWEEFYDRIFTNDIVNEPVIENILCLLKSENIGGELINRHFFTSSLEDKIKFENKIGFFLEENPLYPKNAEYKYVGVLSCDNSAAWANLWKNPLLNE